MSNKSFWLVGKGEFSGNRDGVILAIEPYDDLRILSRKPTKKAMIKIAHELTEWFVDWDSDEDDPEDLSEDDVDLEFEDDDDMVYLASDDDYLVAVKIEAE